MAAVYRLLTKTDTTAALAAADIDAQIAAIIALATTAPKQVTVISGTVVPIVNAATADAFTASAMIQYNTQ